MPFRATFSCLWCGTAHATRGPDDLEGWAQLCPECLGRAGENAFLRFRLRDALAERAAAAGGGALAPTVPVAGGTGSAAAAVAATATIALVAPGAPVAPVVPGAPVAPVVPEAPVVPGRGVSPVPADDLTAQMLAYYEARAPEYDDWYLRRGRYARGPIDDTAWAADLDTATLWLDRLPIAGRIVELAAGTGWWSPLLATKGELWCYDGNPAPLERARERLLAHDLRAHLHVRDAWAEPEFTADALFAGFWLSHVPRARLAEFLSLARRWLRPGGTFALIDSRFDSRSSAVDHTPDPNAETTLRRLDDGREFSITKVFYEPAELEAALIGAGFHDTSVGTTPRFFLLGRATA
jgi:SAM-dependent methyltransferase